MIHVPRPFGVLNVDKPIGMTSRRVVDRVEKVVRPAKVGHAGTLDPLATGVLVVCVGPATKLIAFVQDQPKTYLATFQLGRRSNTDDLEGEVTEVDVPQPPSEADVRAALPAFVGRIAQVPPAYSAVHVDGKRAYKLARSGKDVEIEPRTVEVHRIELLRFAYPEVELHIECGSGTYVRSIGRDLGETLGCGAMMSALRRTRIGPFRVEDAVDPESWSPGDLASPLRCVADLPRFVCDDDHLTTLVHGRPLLLDGVDLPTGVPISIVNDAEELLAIADWRPHDRRLKPRHVFARL